MTNPIIRDQNGQPTGSRLTLTFKGYVPELTGVQVQALLAPLISFNAKTPIEAFTQTLPPKLKKAILGHHVLVGMTTDMVLYAMGRPDKRMRAMEGQMPYEVWIYGAPPHEVQFVRINGNRVIRLAVAKIGQKMVVYTKDEVSGLMRTNGSPVITAADNGVRIVNEGDVHPTADQAPAPPPTLRNPGEKLPGNNQENGVMKPVIFPKQTTDSQSGASSDEEPSSSSTQPSSTTNQPSSSSPSK